MTQRALEAQHTPSNLSHQLHFLHHRAEEFGEWFANYSSPIAIEVCPTSRRLLLEASRLLALVIEDLQVATFAATEQDIAGLDARIEARGTARA